jgi:hypothetical protein
MFVSFMSKKPNRSNFPNGPNGNRAYEHAIRKGKWSASNNNRNREEKRRRVFEVLTPHLPGKSLAQLMTANKSVHNNVRKTPAFQKKIQNAFIRNMKDRYLRAIRKYQNGMAHPMAYEPEYGIGRMHRQGVWVEFLKAENEIRRILGLPLRNIPNFGVFSPFEPPYKPPVNQGVLHALLIRNLQSTWIRRTPTGTNR